MPMGEYDTVGEARALLALHGREMDERQRLVLLALVTELEAARAAVEKSAGYIAHLEVALLGRPGLTHDEAREGYVSAQARYDSAAKAGKAVE